jgi:hypothetical protein
MGAILYPSACGKTPYFTGVLQFMHAPEAVITGFFGVPGIKMGLPCVSASLMDKEILRVPTFNFRFGLCTAGLLNRQWPSKIENCIRADAIMQ